MVLSYVSSIGKCIGTYACSNCGYELFKWKQTQNENMLTKGIYLKSTIHKDSFVRAVNDLKRTSSTTYQISCGKCKAPLGDEHTNGASGKSFFTLNLESLKYTSKRR